MKKTLWILIDNRAGSAGQARGIAQQLDSSEFDIVEKKIEYTKFSGLPNFVRGKTLLGVAKESHAGLEAPYPDLVLSTSRRTVPVARYIKKKSPAVKLVQLMYPGKTGLKDFALVLVPEHDKGKSLAENIFYILGAPHRMTPEVLQKAHEKWEKEFASLPRPLTAVIVGGAIKKKAFSLENALDLASKVKSFKQKTSGSILITTSRRTGLAAQEQIMRKLDGIPAHTFLWGEQKENPYQGYLALADQIIVTGDSVSMCSEACGTNKPVYVFTGQNWLTKKHLRFVQTLVDHGYATLLSDEPTDFEPKGVLNSAVEAAREIEKL